MVININWNVFPADNRMVYLEKILKNENIDSKYISNVYILPIPVTRDKVHILNSDILLSDYFSGLEDNSLVLCGNKSLIPKDLISENQVFDYSDSELFLLKNANLTSHGVIKILCENSSFPFNKLKFLILGFGRIGKNLTKLLLGLESKIYVFGHSEKDLFWSNKFGISYVKNLDNFKENIDFVINTIPHEIISEKQLKKQCFALAQFIELASYPGIKSETCQNIGIEHISALGIPGKIYPKQAAEIIKESILNIIFSLIKQKEEKNEEK